MPLSRAQWIGFGSVATGLIAIAVTAIVLTQTRDGDSTSSALERGPTLPVPGLSPLNESKSFPNIPSSSPSSSPSAEPTPATHAPSSTTEPSGTPSVLPTLSPSGHPSLRPSNTPSSSPSSSPSTAAPAPQNNIFNAGNDGDDIFPLPQCHGDCDSDDDCIGELVCLQRGSSSSLFIPGCTGNAADDGTDYCVDPSDIPPDGAVRPTPNSFRLKMYWEEGYYWQESSKEEFYCMECDGSCSSGNQIEIQDCDDDSTWFEWLNMNAVGITQINVARTNLCFEIVGNNRMELQDCVNTPDYERQQFVAINGTFTGDGRFEIGTIFRSGCLTQQHHPRGGEEIKRVDCPNTRDDDTSFWVKY